MRRGRSLRMKEEKELKILVMTKGQLDSIKRKVEELYDTLRWAYVVVVSEDVNSIDIETDKGVKATLTINRTKEES